MPRYIGREGGFAYRWPGRYAVGLARLSNFLLDARGGVSLHEGQAEYPPSTGEDNGSADDVLRRPVAAFDQHVGQKGFDEVQRSVVIEEDDGIHYFEGGQGVGARLLVIDGAVWPLEAVHRGAAVQAYHQAVAQVARLREVVDMAVVQQVEATVGKHDALSLTAPLGDAPYGLVYRANLLADAL